MAIANFIPEIWANALLMRFAADSVVTPTVNRDYEGDATKGNTVHITQITTPTVVDYSATRTLSPEELSDSGQDLLIDQEKAIGFKVGDIDRVQAAGSFDPVTRDSANALREDGESYILTQMTTQGTSTNPSGTAARTIPTDGTGGDVAYTEVLRLRTELSTKKTPAGGRWAVVNPDFAEFLLGANSKLTSVDTSGNNRGLRDAIIGRLLGFTFVESPLLNPGTPTIVGYHTQAVTYVNQIDKVEALRAQDSFADVMRMLHVYGSRVTRPDSCQYYIDGGG